MSCRSSSLVRVKRRATDTTTPISIATSVPLPSTSTPSQLALNNTPQHNLCDLVDLHQCGEKVEWPYELSRPEALAIAGAVTLTDVPLPPKGGSVSHSCSSSSKAPPPPRDPDEIFRSAKPKPLPPPPKRIRKCLSLSEYNKRARHSDPVEDAPMPSTRAASHFDDPDAHFSPASEGSDGDMGESY